jgi:hypothetical protein
MWSPGTLVGDVKPLRTIADIVEEHRQWHDACQRSRAGHGDEVCAPYLPTDSQLGVYKGLDYRLSSYNASHRNVCPGAASPTGYRVSSAVMLTVVSIVRMHACPCLVVLC